MKKQLEQDLIKFLKDKMAAEICRLALCRTTKNRASLYRVGFPWSPGLPIWAFYQQVRANGGDLASLSQAQIRNAIKRNAPGNYEIRQSSPGSPIVVYWLAEDAARVHELAVKWWTDQGFSTNANEYKEIDPVVNRSANTIEELEEGWFI